MSSVTDRMKEDWDQRAKDDAWYWVSAVHPRQNQDVPGYYEVGKQRAMAMIELGLQRFGLDPSGKTLLEIGCGPGRLFPGFSTMGFGSIIGTDVSPEMIEKGRLHCPTQDAQFLLTNGLDFQGVGTGTIDFCFSYGVFQHFPNLDVFWRNIDEMHRVLKPGGVFQIHFRGERSTRQQVATKLPPKLRRPVHTLYRMLSMKWLRGKPVSANHQQDPGHEETWELGVAISPHRLTKELRERGLEKVTMVVDADYGDNRRYWALGQR